MKDPRIAVCVFAKPPRPGEVKTRLATAVGEVDASRLARAFFEDTWALVSALPWARPILATTDRDGDGFGVVPAAAVWWQGNGDLGARLERVLRRASHTHAAAIALGADSPGLPRIRLEQARAALEAGDAVVGPTADGGFDLVGLPLCPRGVFRGVRWSSPDTCVRTIERLRGFGLEPRTLFPWFDVDRPADLLRLHGILERDPARAPATAAVLSSMLLWVRSSEGRSCEST